MNQKTITRRALLEELELLRSRVSELETLKCDHEGMKEELQREAREREALAEIGRIISSSLDIEQVYERYAEQVSGLIRFDRTAITTIDAERWTFATAYESGTVLNDRPLGKAIPLAGTVTELVVVQRSGRLIHNEDRDEVVREFPGFLPSFDAGLRSGIAVPLISNDEVIGVLFFETVTPNAYTQRDFELAEQVSSQIAGAVANAKLYKERMEAQKALRQSVERFDLAVQGSGEGLWDRHIACDASDLFDPDAEVYYSPRFKEMLGYKDHELPNVYSSWRDHIHSEDRERVTEALRAHVNSGAPYDVEFRMRAKNGECLWFGSQGQATADNAGNRIRMAGSLRDITERKKLEKELLQSQKMEALGTLSGGIAHDFNNLLTAILGYTQLGMLSLDPDDRLHGNFQEIERAAERAAGLTKQLLTFSRSNIVSPTLLNLNELIFDINNMLRRLIGEDIEMVTLPSPIIDQVNIDPVQIEQVIINLVVNARDAMPNGGKIIVKTQNLEIDSSNSAEFPDISPGNYVLLSVEDTGTGIEDNVKDRVFDPFFTTKDKGKGTGLGLSTCYGIVTQVGGTIALDTLRGRGSVFKIVLPSVESSSKVLQIRDYSGYLPQGNETILLVEDEPSVREVATRVLRERGYSIVEADNGAEALSIAQNSSELGIDLVLTDVVMPLMGGRELVNKLKKLYPNVKVLYTSGYDDQSVMNSDMIEDGGNYMQKPFTPAILARKVRAVLDS